MPPKKSKKEFDSEKRFECGYCDVSMVRRQLTEHTKKFCSVAKGKRKPNWEKAPKGQPTLQFALKVADGKMDRCMQEVWLCDNSTAINKLPLEDFEKTWRRDHLGSLKKDVRSKDYDVAITNFRDKEVSNLLFLEAN